MPRLGETLIRLGYCSAEQVQEGLAAQVVYGARLGTNLIELGHIDLDRLARGLARRSRMPAALAGHFERRDLAIQAKVPADLASKMFAVPLGKLAHDAARIAVAVRDRLTEHARGELAFFLDVDAEQIVEAVAPELRLYYHLELAYQIPRANRFLRVDRDRSGVMSVPIAPPSVEDSDVDGQVWTADAPVSYPSLPPVPSNGPTSDIEPAALDYQTAPMVDDETGRARRRFVPELGGSQTLARIAVRARSLEAGLVPATEGERAPPRNHDDLVRTIRRATTRERVAELVVGALAEHPSVEAVVLLVVRQQIAIGWKGYCADGATAIESLAIALGGGGTIARCYQTSMVTAQPGGESADQVDAATWALLGGRAPEWLIAAPIGIGEHTVCVLYGHGADDCSDAIRDEFALLADAAGTAFGRMIRAAQR